MNAWVIFRRARIVLFTFLVLLCLSWTTLFAIFLSNELPHFSRPQKWVVVGLLSLYGCTAVLLYLMIVVYYRFWWDVARVLMLLVVHTGSSVLFTIFSPKFPCHGFGSEPACRKFVFTIWIGCWVFSGIVLFVAIVLGIMAFVPRPVEPLSSSGDDEVPPSPASFKAGSPSEERQVASFYSVDSRTGLVSYSDQDDLPEEPLSPNSDTVLLNAPRQETITVGPPRLWQSFQIPNPMQSNNTSTFDGATSMRNALGEHTSIVSGPKRTESYLHSPFRDPSPPPASIHSQASMIRTSVGGAKSPPPAVTQSGRPTEYTPILYSFLHHYSLPAAVKGDSQLEEASPDRARKVTSGVFSHHGSVHSKWEAPTQHTLPPPVITPDDARLRGPSTFLGLRNPSLMHNARVGPWGSNGTLKRQLSDPSGNSQRFGAPTTYQPRDAGSAFPPKGSDGQPLDRKQWERLVYNAAAKP
ncbi:hypothetical protein BC827DRAFT_1177916 [Russula dissimulans]|nr:hypothetical protein BC827DRAFT_1177916 [Russula dissimulans]